MKNDFELSASSCHNIGEYVIYRNNGICKISDIISENFGGMGEKKYYSLVSVYNEKDEVYVPVESFLANEMYRLLTAKEIDEIIIMSEENDEKWISDSKERSIFFQSVVKSGDRTQILRIFKLLSLKKMELESQKKKLHLNDERILALVQKLIVEEFSFVLEIPQSQVVDFIIGKIKNRNK